MATKHAPPTAELLRSVDAAFRRGGNEVTDRDLDAVELDGDRHLEEDRPRKRSPLKAWAGKKKR